LSCELIRRERKKMRKLLKSKKALSPVVAAIILIAVTVAVSIAVAVWMGSLTTGFMNTKEITVIDMTFQASETVGNVTISVTNTGTSDVSIGIVKLNGATITSDDWSASATPIESGETATVSITGQDITTGNKYKVDLFASDGTLMGSYEDTA
jgi:flagellin-like protein